MSDALVNYPGLGSLWLHDAVIERGFVVGRAFTGPSGAYCDAFAEDEVWNFPISCIRKWEPPPTQSSDRGEGG